MAIPAGRRSLCGHKSTFLVLRAASEPSLSELPAIALATSTGDTRMKGLDACTGRRGDLPDDLQRKLHVARLSVADARGVAAVPRAVDQAVA